MNRQRVEGCFYFVGERARGNGQPLHRCGGANTLTLLHHQAVNQVQACADFVVAGVLRPDRIRSRFSLAQRVTDQTKAPGVKRGGQKRAYESDATAKNEEENELAPYARQK